MAKLIGNAPNQVPTNGDLGDLAYQNKESVKVEAFESNGIDDNATSTAMTIDNSGKVGIGTNSPAQKLHLSDASPRIRLEDSDGTDQYVDFQMASGDIYYTARDESTNGQHIFRQFDGTTLSERMRIDSSGKVGIGNTSPATKLDVTGTVTADSYTEGVYNLTGTAIDPANGSIQYKTLSANTTFTESLEDGQSVALRLEGGSTYTVTWPTMTWIGSGGNVAPTLNGTKDVVVIWQENSTVYGAYVGYGA
jgi:hypothetical protein